MIPSSDALANRRQPAMNKPGIGSDKIIRRRRDGELEYLADNLTIEEPLEIRVAGKTVATTMRTPGRDEELAVGFLISEAMIQTRDDIAKIARTNQARNADNIITIVLRDGLRVQTSAARR